MKFIYIYIAAVFLLVFSCSLFQTDHYITTPSDRQSVAGVQDIYVTPPANFNTSEVSFYIDSVLKTTVTTSPYKYTWNTRDYANGEHKLSVEMYSVSGQMLTDAITVFVAN